MLSNPLLEKGKVVEGAGSLLLSIVGGPDLTLKEVGEITDTVTAKAGKDCHVFIGTVVDENWENKVTLTAVVSDEWRQEGGGEEAAEGQAGAGRRSRPRQTKLKLESYGKGRFKDVEPTILDGEDLDIPTFVRRGIPLGK
jgi:cell division protein FtsZ